MPRPSKANEWTEADNLLRIKGWAREGLTDKVIAEKKIGISERQFCRWKETYPSIMSALKEGHAPVDVEIEDSLYNTAKGHIIKVKKPIKLRTVRKKDGMELIEERVEIVEEEQYVYPNVTAQIFWLKNRMGDKWKDKRESVINDIEDLRPLAELLK